MEILIISGLSGGGKSKAASFLEDIGGDDDEVRRVLRRLQRAV